MTRIPGRIGAGIPGGDRANPIPPGLLEKPTAGVAVVIAAYLGVLFDITNVVGGGPRLAVAVVIVIVAATAFARAIVPRTAVLAAAAILGAGLVGYYVSVPPDVRAGITAISAAADTLRLVTGVSVLRIVNAETWVLVTAPIPTFLAWYLACRARYVGAALAAGGMLGFLVLTGNAGVGAALLGVAGVALAVGLTTLPAPSGIRTHWETLALLIAVMVVVPATVTVLPFEGAQPAYGKTAPNLEATVTTSTSTNPIVSASPESLEVVGDVQLSPEPRFRIRSQTRSKWQTAAYDRYTGSGWVRTGEAQPLSGRSDGPPGETVTMNQTVTALTGFRAYPAAWKPVSVQGPTADTAEVVAGGNLKPGEAIGTNETVRIESEVLRSSPDQLREAGTEYPERISDRYTQLPESTPDRVGNLTSSIIDGVDSRYDAALTVEEYLPAVKNYSLNVNRPQESIADAFLFEMRAGYCTYFATTMVTMLRSQGIPARFVTGYASGEEASDGEWLVRAQDAHAWVQVYFPGHGWVNFDPTPGGGREAAREQRLERARQNGVLGNGSGLILQTVTPGGSANGTPTPLTPSDGALDGDSERIEAVREEAGYPERTTTPGEDSPSATVSTPQENATPSVTFADPADEDGGGNGDGDGNGRETIPLRDRTTTGYVLLVLVGLVALAHGTGTTRAASRALWLHAQPRGDPAADIERAFARLQALLERQHRERRPRETPRSYVAAIDADDDRIDRVVGIYERARYGNEATQAEADAAVQAVDGVVTEATPTAETPLRWASVVLRRVRRYTTGRNP